MKVNRYCSRICYLPGAATAALRYSLKKSRLGLKIPLVHVRSNRGLPVGQSAGQFSVPRIKDGFNETFKMRRISGDNGQRAVFRAGGDECVHDFHSMAGGLTASEQSSSSFSERSV